MIQIRQLLPVLVLLTTLSSTIRAAEQPNFLIIMADDCTYNDLSVYGGRNAHTPNIDRLAAEGLVFNRAYLGMAMCQPCRAELFTGRYPLGNGCAWNHSASLPAITSMPHHLGAAGYRVGRAGKDHVRPREAFPFEEVAGFDANCVRSPTMECDLTSTREFFRRDPNQPFCLVVALVEPHIPWVMGDPSRYPPNQIELPPNIADTTATRKEFAAYLAEITYMDNQVGLVLQALDESGVADNTVVLFTSEQGSQMPGCKWTNWDTGLHTALIARWPNRIARGQRTDALVQYADVLPTLLDMAGGDIEGHSYDGTSFRRVLLGEAQQHRKYVYGAHNNVPEGPSYPIRSVSDGRYRFIQNLAPQELYIERHLMGRQGEGKVNNPYWATWIGDAGSDAQIYALVKRYMRRPAEELYLTAEDPYELSNLAGVPEHRAAQERLATELRRWLVAQGDPGAPLDTTAAWEAAEQGRHLYVAPKSP